ncbi:response regulator, partial [Planctomycetota bacterium]
QTEFDVIVTDVSMPNKDGFDLLRRLQRWAATKDIPVVILTNSDSEQDILESYKLHASDYIKKPVSLQGFQEVMAELGEYWFVICKRVSQTIVAMSSR